MRPLKITMSAFGSFGGTQQIDFSNLGDVQLFLIHGPTGAGKSTILDAMCFALFGETSGNERDGRQMRSDFADQALKTEVVFDFAIGAEKYRISRQPDQERPSKRGDGPTKEKHKATLWRRSHSKESDEGEVMATRLGDVKSRVRSLLGIGADEFRKLVVLPQGQFREVLSLPAKDRQSALQTLFRTGIYRRIEETLKERAKGIQDELTALRRDEDNLFDRAEVENEEELIAKWTGFKGQQEEVAAVFENLKEEEIKANRRHAKGLEDHKKLQSLTEAETAVAELSAEKDAHKENVDRLTRARRATVVNPKYEAATAARQDLDAAVSNEKAAAKSAKDAAEGKKKAEKELVAEKKNDGKRKAATTELERLRNLEKDVEAYTENLSEIAAATTRVEKVEKDVADAKDELAGKEKDQTGRKTALEKARQLAGKLEVRERNLKDLEERKKAEETAESYRTAIANCEADAEVLKAKLEKSQTVRESAITARNRVENDWALGRAGALAQTLKVGEPCPVCGSPEHPNPAQEVGGAKDEDLAEARRVVEEAESTLKQANENLNKKVAELARHQAKLSAAEDDISAREKPEDRALSELVEEAEAAVQQCREAAKEEDRLSSEIKRVDNEMEGLGRRQEKRILDRDEAKNDLASLQGARKAYEKKIPESLRNQDALHKELEAAVGRCAKLSEALSKSETAVADAKLAEAEALTELKSARATLQKAENSHEAAKVNYSKVLAASGFENEEVFLNAVLPETELSTLEEEVESFNDRWRGAEITLKQAKQAAKGVKRPDLQALAEALEEASESRSQKQDELRDIKNAVENVEKWLEELKMIRQSFATMEERYRIEGWIADVAQGKNDRRLSFERYVLASLLDQVLYAANRRLEVMSQHRYLLRRHVDVEDGRQAAGLNLDVLDSYTDKPRPVATLSGGEGFLAAFCLALGMADVVQSYSGGTVIETMFIDEGFGNLDSEALDAAIQALVSLQAEGRLVGVISHVPELRERLTTRLEVVPSKSGSTARFVTQ